MPDWTTSGMDLPSRGLEFAPVAARYAEQADADRRLPRPVVEKIVEAGFARHFVPARWGGSAGSVTDLLHAVSAVAEGCTSAGWCASVIAGAGRMGAFLPLEGQRELWAKGADTVVVGALMPRGRATVVSGGWRISGEWNYASAVDFSDWALVCALVPLDGREVPWFFALPREDYDVAGTWASAGMRGTGSNSLVADDVFVPAHRGFARQDMITGRGVGSDAPCHTTPLRLVSGLLFGAPALGAARAALRGYAEHVAPSAGDDPAVRTTLARAAIDADGAGLLMERAAKVVDAGRADSLDLVRNPAYCAYAVERVVDLVERLVRAAGSSALSEGNPLERVWRDVHSLGSHVALRFAPTGIAHGARLLETGGSGAQ
ncbi:acyl-CoA dehydrogenase family protein [Streptomyces sp. CA-210063]|uniref:acyl-CoA dehydrogenase family protein n=1 Tax=Streptomyces sp. CA-210063 TaxID=2801029 RepID=UPI00214CBD54|nr:acyl-CoA dehydrogenase family protein [Streptomyces sp. CA-210063]UUU30204.1 acyl-CoA dehydrogenase family protein [Streptomyces sp. CA-210063]